MIKRDKRNIGKRVRIDAAHRNPLRGDTGTVLGFRGNWGEGIPFVTVAVDALDPQRFVATPLPIRGDWLTLVKEEDR